MRIAILGATSQIAKDLILSFVKNSDDELALYARRPDAVLQWLHASKISTVTTVAAFDQFDSNTAFDVILNFVGVGDPAQAAAMGAAIFDVTSHYDQMALDYLHRKPNCRYIFLSSGAVFGSNFKEPVDADTVSTFSLNNLKLQDYYGIAKMHAESRHRSHPQLHIVDIRVFNYFSHTQDIAARFFITDALRAIHTKQTLITSSENIVRDYIGPLDFYRLIRLILDAAPKNESLDCYTAAPVEKNTLLAALASKFGLMYRVQAGSTGINATGMKLNYFSKNHKAALFGFTPEKTSLATVLDEASIMVSKWTYQ